MATTIEQRLKALLQPLLSVSLIAKGEAPPSSAYAELSVVSLTALGMGDEVAKSVDDEGNLLIRGQRRAEIAIHCTGCDPVEALMPVIDGFRRVSVSERFQLAQIGVEGSPQLKTEMKEDAQWTPNSETYLSFFIHYSVTIKDAVSVIERVHAATDGGDITFNITR
ncbi:hypothetical protein SOASR030_24570 [Leminorella grimontii]|uniref:Phage neck terminator protein gp12-like domain-containing protein n=1 Tax=Leminorella grimontii TaxID=82981 RepID=A0AAV5N450_9GAMM|nr:hypothetical protein [Leminorella grimontii]KFC95059.1 hypothetical protein GLGR_2127 [Leminorella grimontii ATCC 33999 = DSM 5078]GKX56345.1 hypothetical protein SOASR030_24570 [Leminorella grimontii]GKX61389.1 hypothetical protein SOASR031_37040 [Leminorella grimontii]